MPACKTVNVTFPSYAIDVIDALLEAGCDGGLSGYGDYRCYYSDDQWRLCERENQVYDAFFAREARATRQRWENVVAVVGIVSAWRRFAAAPDGRAASSAAKRFNTNSSTFATP